MAVIVIRASYLGGIARSSKISAAYDKGMVQKKRNAAAIEPTPDNNYLKF